MHVLFLSSPVSRNEIPIACVCTCTEKSVGEKSAVPFLESCFKCFAALSLMFSLCVHVPNRRVHPIAFVLCLLNGLDSFPVKHQQKETVVKPPKRVLFSIWRGCSNLLCVRWRRGEGGLLRWCRLHRACIPGETAKHQENQRHCMHVEIKSVF